MKLHPLRRSVLGVVGAAMVASIASAALATPASAATDPTDRSMCPAMMTMTMPMARIRM